jgi:hypothetical protein
MNWSTTNKATAATVKQDGNRVTLDHQGKRLLTIDEPNDVVAENTAALIAMDLDETKNLTKTLNLHQHRTTP